MRGRRSKRRRGREEKEKERWRKGRRSTIGVEVHPLIAFSQAE